MRSAMLVLATVFVATQAHAQADSGSDVFRKVADSSHTSVAGSDVFRRAAQAKEAAENRPDAIATDPNQVEDKFVRRDSIDILHRPGSAAATAPAAAAPAATAPAAPSAPVSPAIAALGAAFTAAGPPEDPKPTPAPKAHHAPAAKAAVKKAPPAEHEDPPAERATVVQPGAAPAITRMGAMPAPAAQSNAVFNDTLSTLQREAASVSEDVAPRYATEKSSIDSVRNAHNARLDSLEATESTVHDSTERRFLHKMAEAARLKNTKPHTDSSTQHH